MFTLKQRELLATVPGLTEELDAFYKRLNLFLLESHNADGTLNAETVTLSGLGLPVGTVIRYAGATAPTGWLLCDGSALSRGTYRTLYDAIGTSYGAGDGVTTFNLPDTRGRFGLGKATAGTGSTLGGTGGTIDHVHTGPSHTHTSTTTNVLAGGVAVATSPTDAGGTGNTGTANPPFQVFNYIILVA